MIDSIHTVTIAIFARDSVLLLQRNPNEYPGHGDKWELIGGHAHENELMLHAAERELAEETGLHNIELQNVGVSLFNVSGQEAANMVYVACLEGPVSITLSHEHQAYHWTPLALALQVPLACKHSAILRDIIQKEPRP